MAGIPSLSVDESIERPGPLQCLVTGTPIQLNWFQMRMRTIMIVCSLISMMTDRQSRAKVSTLEIYLLVRCEESCPKLSNLIGWLRWRLNVVISWRKLWCPLLQCKLTRRFTERKMLQEQKSELTFDKIIEVDSTKKVAALAFVSPCTIASYCADDQYNCLSTPS